MFVEEAGYPIRTSSEDLYCQVIEHPFFYCEFCDDVRSRYVRRLWVLRENYVLHGQLYDKVVLVCGVDRVA